MGGGRHEQKGVRAGWQPETAAISGKQKQREKDFVTTKKKKIDSIISIVDM